MIVSSLIIYKQSYLAGEGKIFTKCQTFKLPFIVEKNNVHQSSKVGVSNLITDFNTPLYLHPQHGPLLQILTQRIPLHVHVISFSHNAAVLAWEGPTLQI